MSKDSTEEEDASAQQDELPSGEDVHMEETELPEAERKTLAQQAPLKEGMGILTSPSTRDGATPTSPETGQQSKLMPSEQLKEEQGQFSPVAASVFIELQAGTEHDGDSLCRTLDLMNSQVIPVTTAPWNTPCLHKT